jgi:hypothetical protein
VVINHFFSLSIMSFGEALCWVLYVVLFQLYCPPNNVHSIIPEEER